jgi:membrane-bound lytic murein transglycosylase D
MKRLLTFIICAFSLQIVKADFADLKFVPQNAFNADTTVLLPVSQVPVSVYQNVIFKRRLDSIRKDVPLDYNEYVQSYIDNYMGRRDEMSRILGLTKYYFPIYEKAFRDAGIPDEIKYLSIVESALNPNAISRVGAAGPWQFMSETAKVYGLKMNEYVDERRDPIQASYAAAAYLKDAYQQFGDWLLAIASYNCGKSNVEHAMEKTGANDYWSIRQYLPAETRGYVPAFIAVNYVMNYYKRHNLSPGYCGLAIKTDTVMVNKFVPLSKISMVLGMNLKDLSTLNPAYRQQIVNGSAAVPRRLIIPQIPKERFSALYEVLNNPEAPVKSGQPIQYAMLEMRTPEIMVAATKVTPIQPGQGPVYHTTVKGETLSEIAAKYGVVVEDLMQWNKELGGNKNVRLVGGLSVKVTRG